MFWKIKLVPKLAYTSLHWGCEPPLCITQTLASFIFMEIYLSLMKCWKQVLIRYETAFIRADFIPSDPVDVLLLSLLSNLIIPVSVTGQRKRVRGFSDIHARFITTTICRWGRYQVLMCNPTVNVVWFFVAGL